MQALSSKPQQANIEGNQETAISLLKSVPRPGIESLLDYLLAYDYFTAPASTVFRESSVNLILVARVFIRLTLCLHLMLQTKN